MPLWRAFLPCRKRGVLCLASAVLEKASSFPGPIRAVAALGGLDGESPLFRARPARPNQGGRSAQAACLVLTLICARLPWIPFAQFGFAFARAQGSASSRLPFRRRVRLDTVFRKQRASKCKQAQAWISSLRDDDKRSVTVPWNAPSNHNIQHGL